METILYFEDGRTFDDNGNFLGLHSLQLDFNQTDDQGNYAEFNEIEHACKFGDVVVVPGEEMEVLRYKWNGQEKQLFCRTNRNPTDGWCDKQGNPEDGVTKGDYWIADGNDHWYNTEAYWQPNSEVSTPYNPEDFVLQEIRESGFYLYRYH